MIYFTIVFQHRKPALLVPESSHSATQGNSCIYLQRKSVLDERMGNGTVDAGEAEGESSGPDDDDKEVNLDNFMTLDSVGDVDGKDFSSMNEGWVPVYLQ